MPKRFSALSFKKAAIIIAATAALGTGGYAAYQATYGTGLSEADQQMLDDLEHLDEAKESGEFVGDDIEIPIDSEGNPDPDALAAARKLWEQQVASLLNRDQCGLTLDDFKLALELWMNATAMLDQQMVDDIRGWIEANFASAVSRASTSWYFTTWGDRATRGEVDITDETGQVRERIRESESITYDRGTWAQMALSLGMKDLYDSIVNKNVPLPQGEENQKCVAGYHARVSGEGDGPVYLNTVITPILAGLLISKYGYGIMLIIYSLVMMLAFIPTSELPIMHFKTRYQFGYWFKKYRFQRMYYFNTIASLETYGNLIWVLYIFLLLDESYQSLGSMITMTTFVTVILMYVFATMMNKKGRKKKLLSTFYAGGLTMFMRAWNLPVAITDTIARTFRNLKIEAQDVVYYDTLTNHIKPHQYDEAVVAVDSMIDLTIAVIYIFSAISVSLIGFKLTFVLLGTLTIILTAFNPFKARASEVPNP